MELFITGQGSLTFGEGHGFTAAVVIAGVSRLLARSQLSAVAHTLWEPISF
ncbi:MAG TPA: hypothetical protein VG759_21700 [Candidatus Angelobacter sp.]|jgi:hypothetical protein|nr:hypothetical protein [Candidatus Angelobacter sp.]